MTSEEAKTIKEGQELWYRGLEGFPEKVIVSHVSRNDSKAEIHLVDNCYIPERDFEDYVFLTFEECASSCEKEYKRKLDKLHEMLKISEGKK